MDSKKIRILLLKNMPSDAESVSRSLSDGGINFELMIVDSEFKYKNALANFHPEIILNDHSLQGFDSMMAIDILKRTELKIPFILLTSNLPEELATQAIINKADDYILKDGLHRLPSAVINAIRKFPLEKERKLEELKKKESELQYKNLIDSLPVAVYTCDINGIITLYNSAAVELWGRAPEIGKEVWCGSHKIFTTDFKPIPLENCPMAITIREKRKVVCEEVIVERPDGTIRYVLPNPTPDFNSEGVLVGAVNVVVDITDKKKLENLYHQANQLASLGNWELDLKTNQLYWSNLTKKIHEVDSDYEPNIDTAINFYKEGPDRETITRVVSEAIQSGKSWDEELCIITAKKQERWVRAIGKADLISGKCIRVFGSFQDIDSRKKVEFALKKSEANLQTIFNTTDIAFILLDQNFTIISLNYIADLWSNMAFGSSLKEGENLIPFISSDRKEESISTMSWVLDGNSIDRELNYKLQDNTVKWYRVKMNPVTDTTGIIIGLCISASDVTERKVADDKIRTTSVELQKALVDVQKAMDEQTKSLKKIEENERRFQLMIERSADMKTLATAEGKMIYASPSVLKGLGYTMEEFLCTPSFELIFPEDAPLLIEKIQNIVQNPGKSLFSQHRLLHKNGQWIWCEGTITNMLHEPGIEALVSNFRNVTERKIAEEEREKMLFNLVQHGKRLEQFAFIVSHNLRAPVAQILGLSNVLQNNISETDRQQSQQFLFDAVSKIDEILKDLNKIVQIKSEVTEYKETVNLFELVDFIKSSIENLIEKKNVEIITNFKSINEVSTIKTYMYSIFYNLILNGIKYHHPHRNPIIQIKTEIFKGKLWISFKDNGTGIDLKANGHDLFGLYKRFHPHIDGKGIGLFMVKNQIEVLGGSIRVESELNVGTEFIIELPL